MMLALTAVHDWEIEQMDVVTAFLNPKVDGDVYMALPQGIEADKPEICKLRKSLYGLKQAPRLWYDHIDHILRSLGLQRCEYDPNIYLLASTTLTDRTDPPLAIWISKQSAQNETPIILLLYVDDMLHFSPSAIRVTTIKHLLHAKYKMTDLGPVHCFLDKDIERDQSRRVLHIPQQRAVRTLLATNGFSNCNGHWTPQPTGSKLQRLHPESNPTNGTARTLDSDGKQRYQSIVGSLMWLMLCTRPDLAFTISMLSKFPPPRLLSTCQQPPTRYDICETRPTSLSSTMYQTLKPPCPSATPTQISPEIPMTENQHLAMYSSLPEALLPGVLVRSRLSPSERWKPNT